MRIVNLIMFRIKLTIAKLNLPGGEEEEGGCAGAANYLAIIKVSTYVLYSYTLPTYSIHFREKDEDKERAK